MLLILERLKCFIPSLLFLSFFWGGGDLGGMGNSFAEQIGLSIENVRADRVVLTPGARASVSFFLTEEADVSVFVYDPDFAVVKTLMSGERRTAGTVSVAWDGTDDAGARVPDEAYLIGIAAQGSDGRKAVYDPTAYSGGEILDLEMDRVEMSGGVYRVYYSLPAAARVCIRAGIHQGPLHKTLKDWEPQPAGDYMLTWDGMDDGGQIRVMDVPGALLDIRGFSLPARTIMVQGSGGDYGAYHRSLRRAETNGDSSHRRFPAAVSGHLSSERLPSGVSDILSYSKFRQNVIRRRGERLSQQYLVPRIRNVSARFKVYLANDNAAPLAGRRTVGVSGKVGFIIEVAPESLESFNEARYEIIVFIDHRRFDEEEQAYSPYTYVLDTNRLENGEHVISINLASMTGQVSSYSFRLDVNN